MDEKMTSPIVTELHESFGHLVRLQLEKSQGVLFAIISLLISIIVTYVSGYIGFGLFLLLCFGIIIYTFYRVADDLYYKNLNLMSNYENLKLKLDTPRLPSLIQVRKAEDCDNGAGALCLLNPSELFSYNCLVTFYYSHEGYERPIGCGEVVNIQDNKIIQVKLTYVFDGQEEIIKKLNQNNAECLKKVYIKPVILKKYLAHMSG